MDINSDLSDFNFDTYFNQNVDKNIDEHYESEHNENNILDISDSYTGILLNEFLIYYKKNYNSNVNNFFDGVVNDDKTSTNEQMDLLYKHIHYFKINENTNKTKLYSNNNIPTEELNNDNIYSLTIDNEIKYLSYSLIALFIEIINLKLENQDIFTYSITKYIKL